jgi:glycosyltransferase involved in cell wall biosynthesis
VTALAPTVLVNAGPWLPVPPVGYGGIENVLDTLIPALRAEGVRVVLAAVGSSTLDVDELVVTFPEGQFAHVTAPYNATMGITHAHMTHVIRRLREGGIDLVHDHLEVVGAATLAAMGAAAPPSLQTLHWDLRKHPDFYDGFDGGGRVVFSALSELQLAGAPENLRRQTIDVVPLAVRIADYPFATKKTGPFLHMSRIFAAKGQHTAARMCRDRGLPLDLAGPVAYATNPDQLTAELADPRSDLHTRPDVRYFLDEVQPLLDGDRVRWIGSLAGQPKLDALGVARALLMPITWDEPGATVVIEAMACGTPVIGMRRGALPMLIEHGVNGFLADTEAQFASYLDRAEEIDPADCRRIAEDRLDAPVMARAYLRLYDRLLNAGS